MSYSSLAKNALLMPEVRRQDWPDLFEMIDNKNLSNRYNRVEPRNAKGCI